jgi:hypothetical protein
MYPCVEPKSKEGILKKEFDNCIDEFVAVDPSADYAYMKLTPSVLTLPNSHIDGIVLLVLIKNVLHDDLN